VICSVTQLKALSLQKTKSQLICPVTLLKGLLIIIIKSETENKIVTAQDQTLNMKYYATKLLHTETDSKCRLYQQLDETIDHVISACPIPAKEQYVKWHDKVSAQIHFNICKEIGVQLDKKHWYEHVPKSVVTSQGGKVTILWIQQVQTDRIIPNNKPDIKIRDNEKGTCMLIDVAISGDRNVIKKEAEILKYKDLNRNTAHVECKSKGDTSNNWSDCDHFQIIQKICEQHTRKP